MLATYNDKVGTERNGNYLRGGGGLEYSRSIITCIINMKYHDYSQYWYVMILIMQHTVKALSVSRKV